MQEEIDQLISETKEKFQKQVDEIVTERDSLIRQRDALKSPTTTQSSSKARKKKKSP